MRFAIIGNSGSGKSTLARWLAESVGAPLLDLDTVAWEPNQIAVPRAEQAASADVGAFCAARDRWIVEGCYANLIQTALHYRPQLIFLNLDAAQCLANCRLRPWEPHKYSSQDEQDGRLAFLLDWVSAYETRDDPCSLRAHRACFDEYAGPKCELRAMPRLSPPDAEVLAWTQ